MRQKDIEIGGAYAWKSRQGLVRVRVVEKGCKSYAWNKQADAVRVEHIEGGVPFKDAKVVPSRRLEPWTQHHDEVLERSRQRDEASARVARVADRLNVAAAGGYGSWVRIHVDDFFELARRLGIDTEEEAH